jgi:hypothetical protein
MIKFILNKQEASNKAKKEKRKTKSRTPGIERFIPDNDAKNVVAFIHTWVTWKKYSIHSVCPWGQLSIKVLLPF